MFDYVKYFLKRNNPKADVTMPSGRRLKLTVRVPALMLEGMRKECKSKGISINEATTMLYSWILNKRIEFEVIKRIRERKD